MHCFSRLRAAQRHQLPKYFLELCERGAVVLHVQGCHDQSGPLQEDCRPLLLLLLLPTHLARCQLEWGKAWGECRWPLMTTYLGWIRSAC